jgi:hypothetical protein
VLVGRGESQHIGDVGVEVVVGEHGPALGGQTGQVGATGIAEVLRRGLGCVEDVLRVGLAVAVAVGRVGGPRRRDELHRTHGPSVGGGRPEDGRLYRPGDVETCAAEPAVVGLDLADAGQ